MRIGFYTAIEGWGGSETYLKSLMLGVRELGHVPVLFGVEGTRLYREAAEAGIATFAWHRMAVPDAAAGPQPETTGRPGVRGAFRSLVPDSVLLAAGCRRDVLRLESVFKATPVDVMHVSVNGYELAGYACRRCGIPSLGMYMTSPIDEPNLFRSWLIRRSIRSYTRVCAQSDACMESWIRHSGISPLSGGHVWNGVDVGRFAAAAAGRTWQPGGVLRLVNVGRLHPMKGLDVLLDAVALLKGVDWRLDLVGEGPQEAYLKKRAFELGIAGRVHFLGHNERPEVQMAQADAFVMASVALESGPAVLAEAMASGLPLITSDFGPLAEMNEDGVTGRVVPAGDPVRMAGAIRELHGNVALCRRLGEAGIVRARKLFSRDVMIQNMIGQYERVISAVRYGVPAFDRMARELDI